MSYKKTALSFAVMRAISFGTGKVHESHKISGREWTAHSPHEIFSRTVLLPLSALNGVAMSGVAIDSECLVQCDMACIWGKPIELVCQHTAKQH